MESDPRSNRNPKWIYDVFISFSRDIRRSFISHLYAALTNVGVNVFIDDDMLKSGDQIQLQPIEGSRISLIVFSENYASSKICLQELEKIMQCRKTMRHVFVPVFYGLDPSDVRRQKGMFGEAFEDFRKRNTEEKDKELTWRAALREAANIQGFVIKDSSYQEIQYVAKGVTRLLDKTCLLDKTDLFVADHPMGLESRVKGVIQLLKNQNIEHVLLLGIWGMGGIGKTTTAKAIYNIIRCNFEGSKFLSDIREIWGKDATHVYLQEQLISGIYKTTEIKISSIELGKKILKERLCRKKVLIVLDDVNELEQLNALCGSREWFGPGSIIIITTRDKHLLHVLGVDYIYSVKEMDESESFELFSWHAFKQAKPRKGYVGLSRKVIDYSGGLPLVLVVLGSYLFARAKAEWKSVLSKLKRIPNDEVHEMLKMSYDGLERTEKEIFLDIACFFIGKDRDDVIKILNGCGFFAEIGIIVLEEKGLVTVDNENKLGMHDLLRDMGREIIRAESPKEPGRRSRLWFDEDVLDVLSEYSGTETIEGLALKIPNISLSTETFGKMKNLRLLQFDDVQLVGDFKYLSSHLRWLCWHKFPLELIPTNVYLGSLVALELEYSNLKLMWKEAQLLVKLKILNLSHSRYLTQTPDFSYLPNLEKLVLKDCPSLSAISDTIGNLIHLLLLDLENCTSLRYLPRSISKLTSLENLNLSGCSKMLGEDLEQMESLTTQIADRTAITRVPFSIVRSKTAMTRVPFPIVRSKCIGYNSLFGNEGFSRDVFSSLIWPWMSPTNNPSFASMSSLVWLDLPSSSSHGLSVIFNECPKLQSLRVKFDLKLQLTADVARILVSLYARNCKELETTPITSQVSKGLSNSLLIQMGTNCQVTNIFRESILQKLSSSESDDCLLPGDNDPYWLTFNGEGSSVIFEAPQVEGSNLKTMMCIVYSSSADRIASEGLKNLLIINYTKTTIQLYKRDALASFEDEGWQRVISNIEPGNKVKVVVVFGYGFIVKKTAVYLIYEPIDGKMDHCHAPDKDVLVSGGDENSSIYDVFLSFKGEDTRATFTSHLCTSLQNAGIYVFKEDDALSRGEPISFPLQQVKKSTISVIVLSRNYANSRWCLQELENIMLCHRIMGKFVVPVFYDVDPSEVRNQTGMFGEAFKDLLKKRPVEKDLEMSWRKALREAGEISGFVIKDSRNKSEDLKNVVERVTHLVGRIMFIADHPVGVESHVQYVNQLLKYQKSEDVLLLGIWGMGGIGKTTIAKAIYNQIGCNFDGSSFLLNIREVWKQYTRRVYLQEFLLFDIFRMKIKIDSIELGKKILKERLCRNKLLLVLDDVNKLEQLSALCGSREWFGPGSIIIITTRDKRLLSEHGVDHIYRMKEMNESDSVELFSWHAFKQDRPRKDFARLTSKLVAYSGGLPLALVVLGSELFGREITDWESTVLDRLKRIPHPAVQKVLKISFDGLNDEREKDIFLDIACFFIGMDRNVVKMEVSKVFGDFAETEISVLEGRSLVTIDEMNKLGMHVLLRDMGKEIINVRSRIEPGPRIHDVFLSFRGEDTRGKFIAHLYASLQNAGISVFRDDDEIQRGDRIQISLLQAIRRSKISIIVLSERYANSRWCLVELEKIMECHRTISMVVLPVFYEVQPSDVRNHETGKFGEAFKDLLNRISVEKDQVQSWRTALKEISGMRGDVIIKSRDENEDIKKVVENVTYLLGRTDLFVADHPVGVKSRVQDVIKRLSNKKQKDVLLLGIWGMGGIGKTTIAKAIYNEIGRDFEARNFLLNIREVWKQENGQVHLQECLLSGIYKATKMKIQSTDSGKKILEERLRHIRVLVVLDDVDKLEQLNTLCGSREWFRRGSIIIITTRDKQLLRVLEVDHEYKMEKMAESESVELFSWHAFKEASPREDFAELCSAVAKYSGGLPLALKVLGSYLCERKKEEWESVLEKLKEIPYDEIQKKLRISFDGLSDDKVKEIFLDIAFFFIGMNRNDVIHILNACGYFAAIGISVLIERSLVTIDNKNKLGMHDLLQLMAREIIREESPKKPEKRSRLWFRKDVTDVLSNHTGTKAVEGLALKLSKIMTIQTEAFKEMKKLRLLQLDGVKLDGDFKHLSRDLRWLCWNRFPKKCTPKNFDQRNLVSIELENSNLKLVWKETQVLKMLKVLNLSHSRYLTKTPDFSYLPKLEKLILKDCPNLSSVCCTIGLLNELLLINFKDCKNLGELPKSIYKLTSLNTLNLSGCSKIDKLEEDLEQMKSLVILIADKTAIKRVPFSIVRSKSIGYISLCGYEGYLRDVFPSIVWSWMSPTNNLSSIVQTFADMSSLVSLDVPNSSSHVLSYAFKELPKLRSLCVECGSELQLTGDVARILNTLHATNCKELEEATAPSQISNSSSLKCRFIQLGMNCQIINVLEESISQKLTTSGLGDCSLPGDNYPDWLNFNGEGSFVIFKVPQGIELKLKAITLCILYSSSPDIMSEGHKIVSVINYTKNTIQLYKRDELTFEDEEWQRVISSLEPGNEVTIAVVFGNGFSVKKTAVYLIYDEPIDQIMEHCHTPVSKSTLVTPNLEHVFYYEDEEEEFTKPLKERRRTSITPKSGKSHGGKSSQHEVEEQLASKVAKSSFVNQGTSENIMEPFSFHPAKDDPLVTSRRSKTPSPHTSPQRDSIAPQGVQTTILEEISSPTPSAQFEGHFEPKEVQPVNFDFTKTETSIGAFRDTTHLEETQAAVEENISNQPERNQLETDQSTSVETPVFPPEIIETVDDNGGDEENIRILNEGDDEEDPLKVIEDKLSRKALISSKFHHSTAHSKAEVQSISTTHLLQELATLLNLGLDQLMASEENKHKTITLLEQLGQHNQLLTSDVRQAVQKLRVLFEDLMANFFDFQQTIIDHQQLLDVKDKLMNDVTKAKGRRSKLHTALSTTQGRLNHNEEKIAKLKAQFQEITSALSSRFDELFDANAQTEKETSTGAQNIPIEATIEENIVPEAGPTSEVPIIETNVWAYISPPHEMSIPTKVEVPISIEIIQIAETAPSTSAKVQSVQTETTFEEEVEAMCIEDDEGDDEVMRRLEDILSKRSLSSKSHHSTAHSEVEVQIIFASQVLKELTDLLSLGVDQVMDAEDKKQKLLSLLDQLNRNKHLLASNAQLVVEELLSLTQDLPTKLPNIDQVISNNQQLFDKKSQLMINVAKAKKKRSKLIVGLSMTQQKINQNEGKIVGLKQELQVLEEQQSQLQALVGDCAYQEQSLKEDCQWWIVEGNQVRQAIQDLAPSFKVALTEKKKIVDAWGSLYSRLQ